MATAPSLMADTSPPIVDVRCGALWLDITWICALLKLWRTLCWTLSSVRLYLDVLYVSPILVSISSWFPLSHPGTGHVQFRFLGSLYPDGSSGRLKADDSVPPGGSHIYNWTIPEGHAPTDADPACLTWVYHSHVDAPRDIATGLIGPLITCKRGTGPKAELWDVVWDLYGK